MKFSLVFSALASIVVLATAYLRKEPLRNGPVKKRTDLLSSVEKREELDVGSSDLNYNYHYSKRDEGKREELYAGEIDYDYRSY
ncbi:hypothetical protein EV424DRAFT_1544221 [Suillus variegatus]|nr:hypothetical protein EV424DRAFT_1544221 [Suillus variegatus]